MLIRRTYDIHLACSQRPFATRTALDRHADGVNPRSAQRPVRYASSDRHRTRKDHFTILCLVIIRMRASTTPGCSYGSDLYSVVWKVHWSVIWDAHALGDEVWADVLGRIREG